VTRQTLLSFLTTSGARSGIRPLHLRNRISGFARVILALFALLYLAVGGALADTTPALFSSFAGNVNFVGTEQTLRTQPDGVNACSVTTGTTNATLAGIPSGATINAAYLYWAGSSIDITTAPDYDVVFEGSTVSAAANRRYTATYNLSGTNFYYFSGVADVTAAVSAKGNGTYSFSGLSVHTGNPQCASSGVLGGWALVVVYTHASEDFRVINVFEGFQAYRGSSITLTPSNFRVPASPINGKHAYITWEGDVGNSDPLGGFSEGLIFNGSTLSDGSNPSSNQFNSVSTINSTPNMTSYGVDFDIYDISSHLSAGDTSATSVYSSGGDLVLLSAEIISVTNTPVADLSIFKTRNTTLNPGQNATYTLTVTNNGPNAETGPITVTDTLPSGLTYSSFSGSGWSCSAAGQVVTCTRAGSLANSASTSVTLTAAVASNASGTKTNTAAVAGNAFDNVSANDSSSDSYTISADLAISLTRGGNLTPGSNQTYTISVTNDGPSNEPGPVTVTDVLPTGLTFVSGSGSGWTCGASGQTVTCTRSGTLAAGVTSSFTLTVAVAANASGAITNTVTVSSSSGLDNNSANNSDFDNYIFSAYAYYAMDESSWAGGVTDSSGNGRNGTRLSTSSSPTGYPPGTPPGSALTGNPGTCGSGTIPNGNAAGAHGVNTNIDLNSVGNSGTIAFWYRGATAWNDGTDRMLLDASGELGNNSADKHFYLVKRGDGSLLFAIEDSGDTNSTATSSTNSFAANTWQHIAVAWNLGADRIYIFINGVQVATSTTNTNGTLGNTNTLYLGSRRSSVGGTAGNYTSNTANGSIDEVYIYNTALSATGVTGLRSLRHPCTSSVHHYELSIPSSSISCMSTTVTITACADSSSPCTNRFTGVSGQTANLTTSGGGTLASNTVAFDGTGVATTQLTFPTAADGTPVTVFLSGEQTAATNPRRCCPDGVNCTVANSCSTTFHTGGFIFSSEANGSSITIPTQISGVSSSHIYLRAVRTDTSGNVAPTKACEAGLTGTQLINFAYQCNNPATCTNSNQMTVNGGVSTVIASNNSGSVSSYSPVQMTFDADGNAPFKFNYSDVGLVSLWASKIVNGTTLAGTSNAFVVKPYAFQLSGIQQTAAPNTANPGAGDASGNVFIRAGEAFSATVTAVNALGNATPSYGRETSAETVKLTAALVAPLGGQQAAANGNFGTFSNGVATGTGFTWDEVGIISLVPEVGDGDYLGGGNIGTTGSINAGSTSLTVTSTTGIVAGTSRVTVFGAGVGGNHLVALATGVSGNVVTLETAASTTVSLAKVMLSSGNVGRFIPHHLALTGTIVPRSDLERTTGSIAAGNNVLAVASTSGIAVGDRLFVLGAGAGGTALDANVSSIAGNNVSLSIAATTSVTNARVYNIAETTGTIAAGSATLTVSSANGIAVGDFLMILGAGVGGSPLHASVNTIAGNVITLSATANTSVASARVAKYNSQGFFTYLGEPFFAHLNVTAVKSHSGSGTPITQNYTGDFVKLHASDITSGANWFTASCSGISHCFGLGAVNGTTPLTGRLAVDTSIASPVSSWAPGVGTFSLHLTLSKPSTTTPDATWGPFDALKVGGVPRDADGVTLPASIASDSDHGMDLDATLDSTNERRLIFETRARLGRIKFANAHGSDLLALPINLTAQYWNGTAYVTNTLDNLTRFLPSNIVLDDWTVNLQTGETSVTTPPASVVFVAGATKLTLAKPSGGDSKYNGSVRLSLPSGILNYLLRNPGRATFGAFKGNNEFIYLRENY